MQEEKWEYTEQIKPVYLYFNQHKPGGKGRHSFSPDSTVSGQFSTNGLTNQIFSSNVSTASKEQEVFTVCTVMHPQKISQWVRRPSAPLNHGLCWWQIYYAVQFSLPSVQPCQTLSPSVPQQHTIKHPFTHTRTHLLLRPSPVRADACHGSSDVSCLRSCRLRCSAAALPAGLM